MSSFINPNSLDKTTIKYYIILYYPSYMVVKCVCFFLSLTVGHARVWGVHLRRVFKWIQIVGKWKGKEKEGYCYFSLSLYKTLICFIPIITTHKSHFTQSLSPLSLPFHWCMCWTSVCACEFMQVPLYVSMCECYWHQSNEVLKVTTKLF